MRILQAADNYPPARGGLERTVQALAQELARRGEQVHVATLTRPDSPDRSDDGGVPVHRLGGLSRYLAKVAGDPAHTFHPTTVDPLLLPRLQRLVDELEPDIVHAHGWMLRSVLSLKLAPHARILTSLHDHGLRCATQTRTESGVLDVACAGPQLRRCLPCASAFYGPLKAAPLVLGLAASARRLHRVSVFLPVSRTSAELNLAGIPAERVRIVPAFVPDDVATEADGPRPAYLPAGDFVIFVGALSRHKGIDTLLAAHRQLPAGIPLVLIGPQAPDTPPLGGTDTHPVQVHTGLPHHEIMAAFRAASIAVAPSRWPEPLGLVAVEALLAGTPVVASAVGGLVEIVDDACGVLVPPGDVDALATAMAGLLSDPPRRARLGAAGPQAGAAFTATRVVDRFQEAYAAALALPPW